MSSSSLTSAALQPRRVPKQARSRERYDRVLETARTLIGEKGNDAVSMREIADGAGVPIGSVYQYFPDKNALLWTLISNAFDELESRWDKWLEQVDSIDALNEASIRMFDAFVDLCRDDPYFARLWGSVQANVVLTTLDQALNERLAETYAARLAGLAPGVDEAEVRRTTLLMASLSSAALQLAFSRPQECDTLLEDFRRLMISQAPGA